MKIIFYEIDVKQYNKRNNTKYVRVWIICSSDYCYMEGQRENGFVDYLGIVDIKLFENMIRSVKLEDI